MYIINHHLEVVVEIVLGAACILTGPSMIEMSILSRSLIFIIFGIPMGLFIFLIGITALSHGCSTLVSLIKSKNGELQRIVDEAESSEDSLSSFLLRFREHYSDFFSNGYDIENEAVQWEATQLYRNILEFRKKRLLNLGIRCEMIIHKMNHSDDSDDSNLKFNKYSDGKYEITEVQEIIAAKTVYKKDEKIIHSRIEKEMACYTIVNPVKSGEGKVICPN